MFLKRLSSRLAIAYLIFFIPSYLIIYGSFYVLATKFLENKDHTQILSGLQTYTDLFEKEGLEGFRKIMTNPKLHNQSLSFLIHISDQNGKTLFMHMPEDTEKFNVADVEKRLLADPEVSTKIWYFIPSVDGDEDALEVKAQHLNDHYRLVVGASTDDRDELLANFRKIFFAILTPLILISIVGSWLIATRMLKPLQSLTKSIRDIRGGQLSSRPPLPKNHDELFDLTLAFNEMIHQIEILIQAMKETIDNVAHDLKTPITRSRVASELALQSESFDHLKIAAEENVENCDSMLKIIDTVFTVAEADARTLDIKKEHFNARNLLEEIVELYIFVAEDKEISLKIHGSDLIVFADRFRMKQAVANLVDNAIKYSGPNTTVHISIMAEGNAAILSVKDSGIGIAKDDIPRIWERLFRADKSRHEAGLGLGLSLVKIFVESHSGSIKVLSEPNQGSEFIITLPQPT